MIAACPWAGEHGSRDDDTHDGVRDEQQRDE
jgi:hypothetical protein